jgi:hypothetical protein
MAPSSLSMLVKEGAGVIENPERAGTGLDSLAKMMINALRALRFFAVDFLGMNGIF